MKFIRVGLDETVEIYFHSHGIKLNPFEGIDTRTKSQLYFTDLTKYGVFLIGWCLSHHIKITHVTTHKGIFFAIYLDKLVIKCYNALGYEGADENMTEIFSYLSTVNTLCLEQLGVDLYNFKINSLASIAVQFLHIKTPEIFITLPDDMEELIQQSFIGGRCELLRQGVFNDVVYFDFPSMYGNLLCDTFPQSFSGTPPLTVSNAMGLPRGFLDVTVELWPKKPYIPSLPKRHSKLGVIYPYGKFRGVFWHEELELLSLYGGGYIKQIHKVLYAHHESIDCISVAKYLLQLRKEGSHLAKRILNSIYGRLAINPSSVKTEFFLANDFVFTNFDNIESVSFWRDLVIVKHHKLNKINIKHNKAVAAIITSRARCKLYHLIMDVSSEGEVLYVDTDAIFLKPTVPTSFLTTHPDGTMFNQVALLSERCYRTTNIFNESKTGGKTLQHRGSFIRLNLAQGQTYPHTLNDTST